MRAVIQRVREASVVVGDECVGRIGRGLLVFVGVAGGDGPREADWLADRVVGLRVFENAAGKFDASVVDVAGAVLVVSQFTLCADTSKGRRPSFGGAAPPAVAEQLYRRVIEGIGARGAPAASGRFGAAMAVSLLNDGPVTIWLDSERG